MLLPVIKNNDISIKEHFFSSIFISRVLFSFVILFFFGFRFVFHFSAVFFSRDANTACADLFCHTSTHKMQSKDTAEKKKKK